jgi:predicted permease
MNDLRFAWRAVCQARWYSATVTGVLGAGIALATVVFAVVDGVLFKPLPFFRAEELFLLRARIGTELPPVSYRDIAGWSEAVPDLRLTGVSAAPLGFDREPGQELWSARVDQHFFDVIGARPLVGGFTEDDFGFAWDREQDGGVFQPVLVSHAMWRQRFGSDPTVVGRRLSRSERQGKTYGLRIAGVLPPGFVFPLDLGTPQPDLLTPLTRDQQRSVRRELQAIARIPSSADRAEILERLRTSTRERAPLARVETDHATHPGSGRGQTPFEDVQVVSVPEQLGAEERPAFRLVAAASALMLLLACVNVAGLSAARNVERRRDLAIRRALGAGDWRLVRSALFEIAMLAAAGTAVALAIAGPLLAATISLLPRTLTLLKAPELDGRVFAAAAAIAGATVLLVALWPAHVAARVNPNPMMGAGGPGSTPVARRGRFVLIASQIALGFALLTAGALSIASFAAAWQVDAGFERDRMILLEAFAGRVRNQADAVQQLTDARERLVGLQGVAGVAVSSIDPLFARRMLPWTGFQPEAWTGGPIDRVTERRVSANFFNTMGISLVDGRWPVAGEWSASHHVAIVSETAARTFWPDRLAIGQRLVPASQRLGDNEPPITVIGVVADTRYEALDTNPIGELYLPDPIQRNTNGVYFHLQTAAAPEMVLGPALSTLTDFGLHVEQASTHEDAMFAALKHRALPAWLFGSLGVAALVVLGTGVLGLLAIATAQRTREIGIRMVVGATSGRVLRLLVREQLGAVGTGLIAGAILAAAAARYLESQLYGVRAYEPLLWAAVAAALVAVALVGTLIPSWRAARVDPMQALRVE